MREATAPTAHARPRAVADLPLADLSAARGELARRWAVALIQQRPLDKLGAVPLEEIVARGPELLEAVLAAVASDTALERLGGGGAHGGSPAAALAEICGASDAAEAAEGVEALRAVLGEALAEELVRALPAERAAAADRLAHACAVALAATLRGVAVAGAAGTTRFAPQAGAGSSPPVRASADEASSTGGAMPPSRLRQSGRAALVDERTPQPPGEPAPAPAQGSAPADREALRADPAVARPARPAGRAGAGARRTEPAAGEIEIRDERGEGPGAWIGAIGRQLERHGRDRRPFAVLLVELMDLERVRARESPAEADRLDDELERTLAAELARARDSATALVRPPVTESLAAGAPAAVALTRERPGRYWLVSPASDRGAARHLSERISSALADWRSSSGAALSVVVGAACCPEDGSEAAALAAYADVDLYAARSAARAHAGSGGHQA